MLGVSAKNKESTSSTKIADDVGIFPVRKSS